MSTIQEGDRRKAMSYFRYASLVTDELAAEAQSVAEVLSLAPAAVETEAADAAGLTTALWRAAHALSPTVAVADPAVGVAGPYSASSVREPLLPAGGAGHLDRMG